MENLLTAVILYDCDIKNILVGECINLATKLSQKKIEEYGIVMSGLLINKQLKHPSSYGRSSYRNIRLVVLK